MFKNEQTKDRQFNFNRSEHILVLSIEAKTISGLKSRGLVMQGYGAYLEGVLIIPAAKLKKLQLGDANADGMIDIADVVSVVTYLTGTPKNEHLVNKNTTDVNNNTNVDKGDIEGIIKIIIENDK